MGKSFDVLKKDWNNLVILDACRYDYFKEVYSNYLTGTLRKITSPAFETTQWLTKTFGRGTHKDIIYTSANPYVNSRGIEADRFGARGRFYKIIEVWNWGWDEKLKTVHPKTVTKAAKKARALYPRKRLVVHYMQPHYPFITLGPERGLILPNKRRSETGGIVSAIRRRISILIQRHLGPRVFYLFGELGRFMGLAHPHPVKVVAQKYGDDILRRAYMKNLEIALESVSELVAVLPGKTVITSDHGYLLGENGEYAQESLRSPHLLFEVPWFEVERG